MLGRLWWTSGDSSPALDWDDVEGHQPVNRLDETDVIFGWGTGKPRERRRTEHDGISYPITVGSNGWWLLLARAPHSGARTHGHAAHPTRPDLAPLCVKTQREKAF